MDDQICLAPDCKELAVTIFENWSLCATHHAMAQAHPESIPEWLEYYQAQITAKEERDLQDPGYIYDLTREDETFNTYDYTD